MDFLSQPVPDAPAPPSMLRRERWWIITALAWPLLLLAGLSIWPGADQQVEIQDYFAKTDTLATPPLPAEAKPGAASEGEASSSGAAGKSRVFWSEPAPGQMQWSIEIPPPGKPVAPPPRR